MHTYSLMQTNWYCGDNRIAISSEGCCVFTWELFLLSPSWFFPSNCNCVFVSSFIISLSLLQRHVIICGICFISDFSATLILLAALSVPVILLALSTFLQAKPLLHFSLCSLSLGCSGLSRSGILLGLACCHTSISITCQSVLSSVT